MKLNIESGEDHPHLFVNEPDGYERECEVPDALGSAVLAAQKSLAEAERALLVWLRDSPDSPMPVTDRVLANHLRDDHDR